MGYTVLVCVHCLQGLTQNPGKVGEQGVCSGVAVLSKLTSICGTSHRQGRTQLYPTLKFPVTYQPITWSRMNVKMLWREMVVMNPLQYHMQRIHYWSTSWPKADQKAHQLTAKAAWTGWPRTNWVDHPRLFRWRAPSCCWCACSTRVKLNKNKKPAPIEVLKFLQHGKWHPSLYPQHVGWPVHLPAHCVMPAHSFCGEYSVKTLYSNHHRSARHKQFFGISEDNISVDSMVDFWMGGCGLKDIWSQHSCPTGKTKGQLPVKVCECLGCATLKAMYMSK